MTIGSGLGSQLGFAEEVEYGTAVTPTHFLPVDKASLKEDKTIVQGGGLQGSAIQLGARRNTTTVGGSGSLECQLLNRGMGLWFQNMMGTTVTPEQLETTTAYKQTHTFDSDNSGKMLTIQSVIPTTSGVQEPYTYTGCKFTDLELGFEIDKNITLKVGVDAAEVVEDVTIAAASYDNTVRPFVGTDLDIFVGDYGSTTPAVDAIGVTKVTVKFERPMKTDRYYAGAGGLKAEPVPNGFVKIDGTISADFVDKTLWADRFKDQEGFSLLLKLVGQPIGTSGYSDTVEVTLPCCFLDGETPAAEGEDVISGDFGFTALWDGTSVPEVVIISDEDEL